MKIAISSKGKDEDSEVSKVSGRAPYYLIFEDCNLVKSIKNPFRIGGGGAGFSVVEMLAEENVGLVLSGNFGHNMKKALDDKGISYKEISCIKIREALMEV